MQIGQLLDACPVHGIVEHVVVENALGIEFKCAKCKEEKGED